MPLSFDSRHYKNCVKKFNYVGVKNDLRAADELKYLIGSNLFLAIFLGNTLVCVQSDDFWFFWSVKRRQTVSAPILFLTTSIAC